MCASAELSCSQWGRHFFTSTTCMVTSSMFHLFTVAGISKKWMLAQHTHLWAAQIGGSSCVCPQHSSASTTVNLMWACSEGGPIHGLNCITSMSNGWCGTKGIIAQPNTSNLTKEPEQECPIPREFGAVMGTGIYGMTLAAVWELNVHHLKFRPSLSGSKVCLFLPSKKRSETWWHLLALGYWQATSLPVLCFAWKPLLCTEASE